MKPFIVWCTFGLLACSDAKVNQSGQKVLEHHHEVAPWVAQVRVDAVKEAQTISAGQGGALLTVALPSKIPSFFAATQVELTQAVLNQSKTTQTNDVVIGVTNVLTDLGQLQRNGYAQGAPMKKSIDLSQANLTDLQYAGLLTQNTKTWGMVKVGERLYPINVGDMIGQGRWPVIGFNAQNMQLKIANKAVTYEKY